MIYREVNIGDALVRTYVLSNYESIDINRRRPMVVICPGGAYRRCSEREAESVAIRFNSLGYNAVILYYTVNKNYYDPDTNPYPEKIFPRPQIELAKTIEWVRANASELNTNPDRIIVMGFSAGGHLAASLGVMWKDFGTDCRPDAMVLCYPVITSGVYAHLGSIRNLTGRDETLLDKVSLEKQVSKDTPPTFIWTTKTDQSVPYQNSTMFAQALDEAGVENQLVIYSNGPHGLSLGTAEVMDKTRPIVEEIQDWPEHADAFLTGIFGKKF